MFLRNAWYVAAWSHEIGTTPLARTILGEPVALWRTSDGAIVAFADRCIHRHVPLSIGKPEGATLRCAYHGLVFDRDGACIAVPGQTQAPPGARVRTYPVVEKWRWVWIWPGDPARADPAQIPDYHWNDDPGWIAVGDRFHVTGAAQLLIDNLLDLSHVQFVHGTTLGNDSVAEFPLDVRREGQTIRIDRWIMDRPPPPMFATLGGFTGNVDRWQLISFIPPTHVVIDAGCAVAGCGARAGNRSRGIEIFSNHSITPETARSCHYFWHHARNFRKDDDALTAAQKKAAHTAFYEDVVLIAAQQRAIDGEPADRVKIDINADAGVLQARRLVERLMAAEQAGSG